MVMGCGASVCLFVGLCTTPFLECATARVVCAHDPGVHMTGVCMLSKCQVMLAVVLEPWGVASSLVICSSVDESTLRDD